MADFPVLDLKPDRLDSAPGWLPSTRRYAFMSSTLLLCDSGRYDDQMHAVERAAYRA